MRETNLYKTQIACLKKLAFAKFMSINACKYNYYNK